MPSAPPAPLSEPICTNVETVAQDGHLYHRRVSGKLKRLSKQESLVSPPPPSTPSTGAKFTPLPAVVTMTKKTRDRLRSGRVAWTRKRGEVLVAELGWQLRRPDPH